MSDPPSGIRVAIVDNSVMADLLARGFKGRRSLEAALASAPSDSGLIHRIVASFVSLTSSRIRT